MIKSLSPQESEPNQALDFFRQVIRRYRKEYIDLIDYIVENNMRDERWENELMQIDLLITSGISSYRKIHRNQNNITKINQPIGWWE